MLVLTRRVNESIMIGDEIIVTLTSIEGRQVKIGIDGPAELPVHRREVYDKIKAENENEDEES